MKIEEKPYILIGSKIKEVRQEAGMSQKDLAESVGFDSATAISLIEAGQRKVSIEDLEKISKVFQKNINFFLGKDNENIDIMVALRADKNLNKQDKDNIADFIKFIKQKNGGK